MKESESKADALVPVKDSIALGSALESGASGNGPHFREYGLAVLKGAIGAIPFAGGLLNEVIFEARSRLKQDRIQMFIAELAEVVGKLGEDKVDKIFLMSEEFSDLADDVLMRVGRNRSKAKRSHFRNILAKGIIGVRPPDLSGLFMNLLEEITDEELRIYENYYRSFLVLRQSRAEGVKIQMTVLDYSKDDIMGLPPLIFKELLQSLIRKGLMFDDSFGRLSTSA